MRKQLRKLALMAMALLSSVAASAEDFTVGELKYTVIDGTSNVKVEAVNKSTISGALVIPATVTNDGTTYNVTEIAERGFYDAKNITSIAIEGNNLEKIGKLGFKDTQGVTGTVTIPASVKAIEEDGFCRCFAEAFVFATGNQLETLGAGAFWGCKITEMPNLPNTITNFDKEVFVQCAQLTTATLPSNLTEIPYRTFEGCEALTSFTTSANITKIGNYAFNSCKKLESVSGISNVTQIGDYAFHHCEALTSITIPKVTEIGNYSFAYCYGLTSISLPDCLTEMGNHVFFHCENLASAKYSLGLTTVPANTFDFCYAMANVTGIDNVTRIEYAGFGDCQGFTSFTIPAGVEYIGQYALCEMQACEEFIFAGNNVKEIDYEAFRHDIKLKSFTMPSSVEKLSTRVFINCPELASVDFSNLNTKITKLPNEIFSGCTSLTSFTVPSHITEIGNDAFNSCTSLETVTFPSGLTSIGAGAFYLTNLSSVTLPASLTSIGNSAFRGSKLTSFTIPAGVTLGTYILESCPNLTSITIAEGVTEIPDYTFQRCSALAGQITIPASVTRIGRDAFCYSNNITEVIFPENSQLKEIAWEAFYQEPNYSQMERFIMPNTVTTLGNGALRGCKKLDWKNFHLSTGVTSLPPHTFCDCGFTEFDLKQTNVTFLDNNVFEGNLFTEFHLPNNVTVGNYVFSSNKLLERFYFEDGSTVTAIQDGMFYSLPRLKYIYLPVDPTQDGVSMPTTYWGSFYYTDKSRIFLDVPENAIATYKAESGWEDFKYAFSLNAEGSTDLTWDDAAKSGWSKYDYSADLTTYNGNRDVNSFIMWTFNNPVEKEYTLLLDAANYYGNEESNHLTISLRKLNADGTSTEIKNVSEKIFEASNVWYPTADHFQQVYVKFDEALPVGKYQLKIVAKGERDKHIKEMQMVPTADLLFVETATSPAGAGIVKFSGKVAQPKTSTTPITLSTQLPTWATFTNWTVNGTEVSTDAEYTFTPTESTTVVANVTPERQVIPTADGQTFDTSKAAAELTYWDGNFFCHVYPDAKITYFITNEQHALYNFKFKTCCGEKGTIGSIVTVDVIDEAGNIVYTEAVKPEYTGNWNTFSENVVALSKPLKAGNYSVKMTITHPNNTYVHLVGVKDVSFEYIATVPETIALDKTEATMWVEDADEQLTATLTPADITTGYDEILWTSSNAEVATVDATGKVTAVAPGTATITAKATGRTDIELTATCEVTVPQHVTDITVPAAQSIYVGDEITLEATALPENAEDKTLTWSSSNTDIATVDATGKVKAVAKGDAVITVTAADRNKVSKTVAVNVKQQVTDITGIPTATQIIYVGENVQITAVAAPETANLKTLTWTTSDATVATVSETGKITAVKAGSAVITVTAADRGTFQKTINVTVKQQVTDITVAATAEVYTGETVAIEATTVPAEPTDGTLTWASADETIATVSDAGVVTGVKAGTVNITVTAADRGTVQKTIAVTVKQAVTAITLNKTSETIHKTETLQLTATYAPADATLKEVTWTSSNPTVASVSETGLVTALAGGTATITATANDGKGATANCAITVDVPVTSVTLDQTSATVYKDVTIQLNATVNPDDATVKTVTWTSSNTAVATVSTTGLVTAVAAGDATITVASTADASKYATFALHVMAASAVGTGANQLLFHEEVNNGTFGNNCVAWDNATDKNWVANSIVLTDAEPFTCHSNVAATSITYNRTFAADCWQPLYVPFYTTASEWTGATVAELAGVHMYDDGKTIIEFLTVSGDNAIKANKPYVIKPTVTGDYSEEFSDKTLCASPVDGTNFISCSSPRWTYKFYGNYQAKTKETLDGMNAYVMGVDKFAHTTSALSPFRFYLVKSASDNGYWGAPAAMADEIYIMVDGVLISTDQTTGIIGIVTEGEDGLYYDLQGRIVETPRHGIFIHNGKKVRIK